MMHGVDDGFDAALLLGYHARTGTAARSSTTPTSARSASTCASTARSYGEFGLNAMLAGAFGVPVVVTSGDDKLVAEARSPAAADRGGPGEAGGGPDAPRAR
jgi:D-amino peptidase